MKKHLIAAAVAAAVGAPAMAQNVSIDGYFEANYGSIERKAASTTKTTSLNGGSDVFGGSEINLRGSEDLGGGLKVGFRLTKEFNESTGAQVSNGGEWTNALISISGSFGEITAGRFISGARDLGGIYRFNGDFGRVNSFVNTAGNRPANQVQYTSPSVQGLSLVVGSAKGEAEGTASATEQRLVALRYTQGNLRAMVSSAKISGSSDGTTTTSAFSGNQKETAIGASYNFGFARVGVAFFKDDIEGANGSTAAKADGKATNLSVEVPLSGGLTLMGSYNKYSSDAASADGTGTAMGVKYALSKRTNLFAVYNRDSNEANANWNFRGYGGTALSFGEDMTRLVVGLNHSF